jgi:8-oxo-dGTP pyrophosphatase MutT (NUDIX family)
MIASPVLPFPAATLIIARPGARVPEILLLKRSAAARFMPNAYVFPGGAVDEADASEEIYRLCTGVTDVAASEGLNLPRDGLRFLVAAVREAFEECGLLYAYDCSGRIVSFEQVDVALLDRQRTQLQQGGAGLARLCTAHAWRLAVDQLVYFAHWITPVNLPRRFDTRFFIARSPEHQVASLVSAEMSDICWIGAREALAQHAEGQLQLMHATRTLLGEIAPFDAIDTLLDYAGRPRKILPVLPAPRV